MVVSRGARPDLPVVDVGVSLDMGHRRAEASSEDDDDAGHVYPEQ